LEKNRTAPGPHTYKVSLRSTEEKQIPACHLSRIGYYECDRGGAGDNSPEGKREPSQLPEKDPGLASWTGLKAKRGVADGPPHTRYDREKKTHLSLALSAPAG
jgi:hypothetical protein